jgi:2-oxoglutarate ferredoxin oxidoreductase subunit gamma
MMESADGGCGYTMQETRIIIAGFGGQGIVALGNVMARACMIEGKNVTGMVAYGPEMRGGTCSATIVVGDDEIACPFVETPDQAIILNQQSLDKFESVIVHGGLVLVNTSIIQRLPQRTDLTQIQIAASQIARDLGNVKSANMVALGAYIQHTGRLEMDSVERGMRELFGGKNPVMTEMNVRALHEGAKRFTLVEAVAAK